MQDVHQDYVMELEALGQLIFETSTKLRSFRERYKKIEREKLKLEEREFERQGKIQKVQKSKKSTDPLVEKLKNMSQEDKEILLAYLEEQE